MPRVTHIYAPLKPEDRYQTNSIVLRERKKKNAVRPSPSQSAYNSHNPHMGNRKWIEIDEFIRQNTTGYAPSKISYEATIRVHNNRNDANRRVDQKTGKVNTSMAIAMRKAGLIK